MFTEAEKAYLREMAMSATWASIVEKLRASRRPIPRYTPGKGTAEQQSDDWAYYSGVDRGAEDLLKLLAHE
jgi:hypothetical protein